MTEQKEKNISRFKFFDINKNWKVSPKDISLDLMIFADDCFRAETLKSENGLQLIFDNGQKFAIDINEI